jgi:hypothetical protein
MYWGRRRHRGQCSWIRGAGSCWHSPVNSRRISLQVSGISWSPSGFRWSAWVAAGTARNAWASRAKMVRRCQEVQLRTWCSSRAASSLPAANRPRFPAGSGDLHQLGQRRWAGGVGAVEGVFAVAEAAADQQPARAVAGGQRRVGGLDQGPVIPAGALGAGPGGHPLPGPGRQPPGRLDRRACTDPGDDQVTPGYGQDVAEPEAGQLSAQGRVLAIDLDKPCAPALL